MLHFISRTYGRVHIAAHIWQSTYGRVHIAEFMWQSAYGRVHVAEYMWQSKYGRVHMAEYIWQSMGGERAKGIGLCYKVAGKIAPPTCLSSSCYWGERARGRN